MSESRVETTAEDLTRWLTQQMATHLQRDPGEIELDTLFADYGLDSVYALTFCADIEDHLGVTVSDTVLWDHPTIRDLVEHLMATTVGAQGPAAR
ncbi:acyl carrier protein [Nocardiopsis tropica]|jgi:acyl carrier protein|uniref:Acyl carrier protein n=1 Tax=Nocardiopsis tropica TaxID=109330 RepID=A0ABU7KM05_9ACTN|nr:acyl carrier protein [Nocardiopsis umidischolae]MEE2050039.1 acyl carrier protein [Nocardiopsis umidischolae]